MLEDPATTTALATDVLNWNAMVEKITQVATDEEALQEFYRAEGYLKCLIEVGLVGIYQSASLRRLLEECYYNRFGAYRRLGPTDVTPV